MDDRVTSRHTVKVLVGPCSFVAIVWTGTRSTGFLFDLLRVYPSPLFLSLPDLPLSFMSDVYLNDYFQGFVYFFYLRFFLSVVRVFHLSEGNFTLSILLHFY